MKIRDILPVEWCKICNTAYNTNKIIYPYAHIHYPKMCQECIDNRIRLEEEDQRIHNEKSKLLRSTEAKV